MIVNLSRAEARTVANILDAFAATSPDDEWTPQAQKVQVKLWRAIEVDDARIAPLSEPRASKDRP